MAAGDEAFIAPGGGAQAQPAARALGAPSPSGLPGKRALRQRSPSPTVLPNSPLGGQPPRSPLCAQRRALPTRVHASVCTAGTRP